MPINFSTLPSSSHCDWLTSQEDLGEEQKSSVDPISQVFQPHTRYEFGKGFEIKNGVRIKEFEETALGKRTSRPNGDGANSETNSEADSEANSLIHILQEALNSSSPSTSNSKRRREDPAPEEAAQSFDLAIPKRFTSFDSAGRPDLPPDIELKFYRCCCKFFDFEKQQVDRQEFEHHFVKSGRGYNLLKDQFETVCTQIKNLSDLEFNNYIDYLAGEKLICYRYSFCKDETAPILSSNRIKENLYKLVLSKVIIRNNRKIINWGEVQRDISSIYDPDLQSLFFVKFFIRKLKELKLDGFKRLIDQFFGKISLENLQAAASRKEAIEETLSSPIFPE